MKTLQLYEIKFQVGLDNYKYSATSSPRDWRHNDYSVKVMAQDLDEVVNTWPKILLQNYPFYEGTGGSHYSEDPEFGNIFKFLSISLREDRVVYNENRFV